MAQTKDVLVEEITHSLTSFAGRIERIASGQFPVNERDIAIEELAPLLGRFIVRLVESVPEPLENWKVALQNASSTNLRRKRWRLPQAFMMLGLALAEKTRQCHRESRRFVLG